MKKLIFLPLIVVAFALAIRSVRAEIAFPITELGNCTSKEVCKSYCDQPVNRQACLTYSQSQKLFEAKNLFDCKDLGSCRDYCARPENRTKCDELMRRTREAVKQKIATPSGSFTRALFMTTNEELGCNSEDSCQAFCSQTSNVLRCQNFLRRHLLWKEEKLAKPPLTNAVPR